MGSWGCCADLDESNGWVGQQRKSAADPETEAVLCPDILAGATPELPTPTPSPKPVVNGPPSSRNGPIIEVPLVTLNQAGEPSLTREVSIDSIQGFRTWNILPSQTAEDFLYGFLQLIFVLLTAELASALTLIAHQKSLSLSSRNRSSAFELVLNPFRLLVVSAVRARDPNRAYPKGRLSRGSVIGILIGVLVPLIDLALLVGSQTRSTDLLKDQIFSPALILRKNSSGFPTGPPVTTHLALKTNELGAYLASSFVLRVSRRPLTIEGSLFMLCVVTVDFAEVLHISCSQTDRSLAYEIEVRWQVSGNFKVPWSFEGNSTSTLLRIGSQLAPEFDLDPISVDDGYISLIGPEVQDFERTVDMLAGAFLSFVALTNDPYGDVPYGTVYGFVEEDRRFSRRLLDFAVGTGRRPLLPTIFLAAACLVLLVGTLGLELLLFNRRGDGYPVLIRGHFQLDDDTTLSGVLEDRKLVSALSASGELVPWKGASSDRDEED